MSDKVKVVLLNDGGYQSMLNVKFPVVVEGEFYSDKLIDVAGHELARVGGVSEWFDIGGLYCFRVGIECEVEE